MSYRRRWIASVAVDALPIALVLAAAGLHAAWNLRLHRWDDGVAAMAVAGLTIGVVLAPAMLLAPPWEAWPLLLMSVLAQTAYGRTLPAAYARGALSFAYPVGRGTAPLLVTVGGWLVLAETPAVTGVAGAVALGTGLVLLARRARQVDQATAVGLALLAGLAIATYQVVDAAAVRAVSPIGYLGASQLGSGVLLAALMGFDRKRLRASLQAGARIGVGQAAAYLLVLFAFQRAPAGPVATLREISVLLAILAARERPGRVVWLGATLCVAGAVLATL
jgi:drug/metabolite transporter (DMT)-like permease